MLRHKLLLITLLLCAPRYRATAQLAAPLNAGDSISVRILLPKSTILGRFVTANDDTLWVSGSGAFSAIPFSRLGRLRVYRGRHSQKGRNAVRGAAIGAVFGVLYMYGLAPGLETGGPGEQLLIGAIAGAIPGAVIGALTGISLSRWDDVPFR